MHPVSDALADSGDHTSFQPLGDFGRIPGLHDIQGACLGTTYHRIGPGLPLLCLPELARGVAEVSSRWPEDAAGILQRLARAVDRRTRLFLVDDLASSIRTCSFVQNAAGRIPRRLCYLNLGTELGQGLLDCRSVLAFRFELVDTLLGMNDRFSRLLQTLFLDGKHKLLLPKQMLQAPVGFFFVVLIHLERPRRRCRDLRGVRRRHRHQRTSSESDDSCRHPTQHN